MKIKVKELKIEDPVREAQKNYIVKQQSVPIDTKLKPKVVVKSVEQSSLATRIYNCIKTKVEHPLTSCPPPPLPSAGNASIQLPIVKDSRPIIVPNLILPKPKQIAKLLAVIPEAAPAIEPLPLIPGSREWKKAQFKAANFI